MRLIFDVETDGLLDQLTTIHSLVIKGPDSGRVWSCYEDPMERRENSDSILSGLALLASADELIGHNIMKFDIPAIQKVYPWFAPRGRIFDTLLASRLIWSDLKANDFAWRQRVIKEGGRPMDGKLIGLHGLEAWGVRLGVWKGDYAKVREAELREQFAIEHQHATVMALAEADGNKAELARRIRDGRVVLPPKEPTKDEVTAYVWGTWNHTMQSYVMQDVEVTETLWRKILSKNYSQQALDLEHDFAAVILDQEREGFPFNDSEAEKLQRTLEIHRAQVFDKLQGLFPPWEVSSTFTPRANNSKLGYVKGVPVTKTERVVFNPGSREHIADRLKAKYGWEPVELTDTGKPKVDEAVLGDLPYPEAKELAELFLIDKRLGQLATGKKAWRSMVKGGRIYYEVVTNGAVTGRCTHKNPNLAQVPKVKVNKAGEILWGLEGGYGAECRGLFGSPAGMLQVGADLSGLELRCLAHYMHRYDGGAYMKVLLEGDIHTVNQEAAGLPTRDNAKTFIYGFLYGAGPEKIGSIVGGDAKRGKELIKSFLDKTPALKLLRMDVGMKTKRWLYKGDVVELHKHGRITGPQASALVQTLKGQKAVANPFYTGTLRGLDGRILPIRSPHAALNTLLQSAGALISKQATVFLRDDLTTRGLVLHVDYAQMAHVHDEVQLWAKPDLAELVGKACVSAFERAGEHFNFRCPITGEFKIGRNWRECH